MSPEEFRAIRNRLGLTQKQMARWMGFAHATRIAKLEAGVGSKTHQPVPPLVERLMRAYEAGYRPHADTLSRKAPQSRS